MLERELVASSVETPFVEARSSAEGLADNLSDMWVIEPRRAGAGARARELWRSRALLRYFGQKSLEKLYKRTVLGKLWLLIRPLFPIFISSLVFGSLLGIDSEGVPYFLFFLVGMASWNLFDLSLLWATRSLELNRNLIKKLYFPRLILPIASITPALVYFFIYMTLVIGATAYFWLNDGVVYVLFRRELLFSIAAAVLSVVFAVGLGFWTSVPGANARDVRFTLRYIMQFWFYLTPVIYPLSVIPEQWQWVVALNPMAAVVGTVKWGVLGIGQFNSQAVAIALVIIGITFVSGVWFFGRAEASAVDRM